MAELQDLTCAGSATFANPGTDPDAPARLRDLRWVDAAPLTSTSPGEKGQYHCDGAFLYVCFAVNQWARTAVASTWT